MKTFVIAEAGSNHNNDYETALKLIDAATSAGCDAVKFQIFSSNNLYAKNTPDFAGYKNINELIESIEIPRDWISGLKTYCDHKNIEFMATPFDEEAVDQLCELDIKRIKIAGFEATDPRFVKYVAATGKPLIVTAGIGCDIKMINQILDWICEESDSRDITILHGNHAYPTPIKDINLGQLNVLKKQFEWDLKYWDFKLGLSDHTEGIFIPPLAVAMGASIIEKHFTLDRTMDGPDHAFAIEPNELTEMVKNIRLVEKTLSTKQGSFTESEEKFKKAMRSVVAKKSIKKGEVFDNNNITTKRPYVEGSISAKDFYKHIGKFALNDIKDDEIVLLKQSSLK